VGPARLDAAIVQRPGRLSVRLEPRAGRLTVDLRPIPPPGARDVALTLDGARASRDAGGAVAVALDGRPRTVELRWTGGLAVESPVTALEPGQSDRGVRVLDFSADASGWRLALEGPAGETATVHLHGEAPASAEGATLVTAGAVTEATAAFPAAAERFSKAEIRLRRRAASAPPSP
jgi:hypothetical protein